MKKFIGAIAAFLIAISPSQAQVGFGGMFPGPGTPASSGGGIAFNNFNGSLGNNGGSGNYSANYTGATLTHGLLVLCIEGGLGGPTITSATYGGVAMTLVFGGQNPNTSGRSAYEYWLLNPASGSNTLAITQSGGDFIIPIVAEYSGVKQTSQPDATSANASSSSVTSFTSSITIANNGSWSVLCSNTSNGPATWSNGTGATFRGTDSFADTSIYDSAGPVSPGAYGMTVNFSASGFMLNILASFQPG
jgi:hypothetical protein